LAGIGYLHVGTVAYTFAVIGATRRTVCIDDRIVMVRHTHIRRHLPLVRSGCPGTGLDTDAIDIGCLDIGNVGQRLDVKKSS